MQGKTEVWKGKQKFGMGDEKGARWVMVSVGRPRTGSERGRLGEGIMWWLLEGER